MFWWKLNCRATSVWDCPGWRRPMTLLRVGGSIFSLVAFHSSNDSRLFNTRACVSWVYFSCVSRIVLLTFRLVIWFLFFFFFPSFCLSFNCGKESHKNVNGIRCFIETGTDYLWRVSGFPHDFLVVSVLLISAIICVVFISFVCLRPVHCVPNVADVSRLSISWLSFRFS